MTITAARSWLGTRFQHQGRLCKTEAHKGGCDCLGLLMGVAKELNLIELNGNAHLINYDVVHYSLIPDGKALEQKLKQVAKQINLDELTPGDIALFRCDGNPQHLAIISNYNEGELGIIHAYAPARKVVEHHMSKEWKVRLVSAFRLRLEC
jgi:NlpC/P60 family.